MITDDTTGLLCGDQFGFLYPRRHHCRLCGGIFCNKCSSPRLQLSELKEESSLGSRSCLRCYSEIRKAEEKIKDQENNNSCKSSISNGNDSNIKEQVQMIETTNENNNPNIVIDDSNSTVVKTPMPSDSIMLSILRITRNEGLWEYDDISEGTPASSLSVLTPVSISMSRSPVSRSPFNARLTPLKV